MKPRKIFQLPLEILRMIFALLPPRVLLVACPAVCRVWRSVVMGMRSVGPFVGPNSYRDARGFCVRWSQVYRACALPMDFARGAEAASLSSPVCLRAFGDFFAREISQVEVLAVRKSFCVVPFCTRLAHLCIGRDVHVDNAACRILARLTTLKSLRIRNSSIASLSCFRGNVGLEHLELSSCVNICDISSVCFFSSLVSFRHCLWAGQHCLLTRPYDFSGLANLEHFELSGMDDLNDVHLDGLYDSTKLVSANISGNFLLTSAALRFLYFTPFLRILNISYTPVSNIVPVSQCHLLEELYANNTEIKSPVPASYCPRLRVLSLRRCPNLDRSLLVHFMGNCPMVEIKT